MDVDGGLAPVYTACLLEDFRREGSLFTLADELLLGYRREVAIQYVVDRVEGEAGTKVHEFVMHISDIVGRQDFHTFL